MASAETMTVLQIWFGTSPSQARLDAMNGVLEWSIANGHRYKLLGDNCVLNMRGQEYETYEDFLSCNEELRQILSACVWQNDRTRQVVTSDLVRLFYLAHNRNTLYVDTDAQLVPPLPEFTTEKPWFAWYGEGPTIDSMLIHGDGQQLFEEIIDAMVLATSRDGAQRPMLWDLHIVLNKFVDHVDIIPRRCFVHKVCN